MSTFDHGWYCIPRSGCRQGTEMREVAILAVALWLTPEESAWQRLWRGQRHHNRLRAQSGWRNQREQTQSTPIPTCVQWNFRMWLWRIPGYGGWPLIIINSSHNNNWIEFRRFIVLKRQWRVRCIFHKNLNQNSGVRWIFISFLLMTLTNLRNHLLIVEKHVPSYERCSLYFLRMVKDGRKKVATINNNLFAGAQNWGNHFTRNSKVCRVECQKCGV